MAITATAQGKTFTFPDGTSPEDMGAAIDEYFQGQQPAFSQGQQSLIETARANLPQEKLSELSDQQLLELQQAKQRQLSASLPADLAERQSQLSSGVSRKEIALEQLQQANPDLAALIESLSPAEKAAIGFQRGLRKVGRGAAKLVGQDVFQGVNDPSFQALRETSFAAAGGEIAGESAPFAAAGPLTGTVGKGLTATRGGATLVPEVTSTVGRTAIQSGIGAAEGAAIAAGEDRSAGEVALTAGLGGIIGGAAELGATRALGGADQLPRQLVEEGEDLLRRSVSPKDISKAIDEAAPSIDQLRGAAKNIYSSVKNQGVEIDSNFYSNFADKTIREAQNELGLNLGKAGKTLTPQSRAIVDLLDDIKGQPIKVDDLENIRKAAQNAISTASRAGNNNDAAIAGLIVDRIDELMTNIGGSALTGNAKSVGAELATARKLWGRARKAELLNEALDLSTLQASGIENGIRTKFRQIINNKRQRRFFNKEELKAMQDVVEGTAGSNFFKRLGKVGFGSGQQTNVLGGLVGSGVGSSTLGSLFGAPGVAIGAVLLPTVGTISKDFAEKLTKNNAALANRVVRAGSDAEKITKAYFSAVPKDQRSVEELSQLLMRSDVNLDSAGSEIAKEAAEIARRRRQQLGIASTAATGATAVAADEEEQP